MHDGSPELLGATPGDGGVNFAVYSSVAERIELCLFDEHGTQTVCHDLPARSDGVWHGFLPGCAPGQRYGYRAHGPWRPGDGLRCNPSKLLCDPYARALDGSLDWSGAVFGHAAGTGTLAIDATDSAPFVPKSVVCGPLAAIPGRAPRIPWSETVIYETNVRGYTMRHGAVEEAQRGTFAGMKNGAVLDHLKALGITAVELLPVQAFVDEEHLARSGLRNFWGYNTLAFFAPMPRYAAGDPRAEFIEMVNAIHDAGIEVILDIVFNHTCEGDARGPTLSFRGFDNPAYYRLEPQDPTIYVNDTGTGNTLNADHPAAQRLVLDCLAYWTRDMGVDGFRFDLAPVLGRHTGGFSAAHPLLQAITREPALADAKLIAEPWDPGPGGYQLGHFPPRWGEWNDKYRDTLRRFWRGDHGMSGEFARRIHGSADIFDRHDRSPASSVNFVTSHDGFTLADLVSYEHRHNHANLEQNRDGHAHNYSCNHGVEGPTDDTAILAKRRRHRLNLLATLLFSQGTPMLLAGDELGNSQAGNNNAYAQDNDTGWVDWSGLRDDPEFVNAVATLVRLRRECALLRLEEFLHGETDFGEACVNVEWLNREGNLMEAMDWTGPAAFKLLFTESTRDGVRRHVALLINGGTDDVEFRLPAATSGFDWRVLYAQRGAVVEADPLRFHAAAHTVALLIGE